MEKAIDPTRLFDAYHELSEKAYTALVKILTSNGGAVKVSNPVTSLSLPYPTGYGEDYYVTIAEVKIGKGTSIIIVTDNREELYFDDFYEESVFYFYEAVYMAVCKLNTETEEE